MQVVCEICEMKRERKSDCPINYLLEMVGDRWSLLIIRDLMFRDKKSYGEFQESEECIATNILSARLKSLQQNGLIDKKRDPSHGSKFIYALTEKGIDLLPVLLEMTIWSDTYETGLKLDKDFIEMYKANRNEVLEQVLAKKKMVK